VNESVVLIFARTPERGKVKTRLAADVGDEQALSIYERLLEHTCETVLRSGYPARVYMAGDIPQNDIWSRAGFARHPQASGTLGERMHAAFSDAFRDGIRYAVIIGTDCPGLKPSHLHDAMNRLETTEAVVGPAEDGGYVLLGLTSPIRRIFENKDWSTDSVLHDTIADFRSLQMSFALMEPLRDIDTKDDLDELKLMHTWLQD
jgi:rSAM/selenodomain-associated transferase 1